MIKATLISRNKEGAKSTVLIEGYTNDIISEYAALTEAFIRDMAEEMSPIDVADLISNITLTTFGNVFKDDRIETGAIHDDSESTSIS